MKAFLCSKTEKHKVAITYAEIAAPIITFITKENSKDKRLRNQDRSLPDVNIYILSSYNELEYRYLHYQNSLIKLTARRENDNRKDDTEYQRTILKFL